MNKIKTLVASVALAAGIPAMAAYHSTPAPVVPCKQHQLLPKVDRNQTDFMAQCDWDKRIKISGIASVNYGHASDVIGGNIGATRDFHHMLTFVDDVVGNNAANDNKNVDSGSDIWLQRAVVNFDAVLNDWAESHVSLLFWNEDSTFGVADAMMYNRYQGVFQGAGNAMPVNEANIVLGNMAQTPVFFRVGRQYMDFGWYDKTTTVAPMTQLFSQSQHDAVQVGFMDVMGFNGSVAVFRSVDRGSIDSTAGGVNPVAIDRPSDSINNFVASIGYGMDSGSWGFDAKVDYMHDMFGVDFFDGYLGNGIIGLVPADFTGAAQQTVRPDDRNSMWAATVKGHFADFDAMGQYVGVSGRLDEDLWTTGGAAASAATDTDIKGAKPSAWVVEVGYSFPLMGRDSRISLNYQKTHDAYAGMENISGVASYVNYYIPEKRVQVGFSHNLMKNVDLGLTYVKDEDYGTTHFQSMNNRARNNGTHGNQFNQMQGTGNENTLFLVNITGRFS